MWGLASLEVIMENLPMSPDDVSFMRGALVNIQSSLHDLAVKVSAMDQRDETLTVKISEVSRRLDQHMDAEEDTLKETREAVKEIFQTIRAGLGTLLVAAVSAAGWLLLHHDDIAFIKSSADRELPVRMEAAEKLADELERRVAALEGKL